MATRIHHGTQDKDMWHTFKHSVKRGLFSSQLAAIASAGLLVAWSVWFMSKPFHFPFHVMASMFFGKSLFERKPEQKQLNCFFL